MLTSEAMQTFSIKRKGRKIVEQRRKTWLVHMFCVCMDILNTKWHTCTKSEHGQKVIFYLAVGAQSVLKLFLNGLDRTLMLFLFSFLLLLGVFRAGRHFVFSLP